LRRQEEDQLSLEIQFSGALSKLMIQLKVCLLGILSKGLEKVAELGAGLQFGELALASSRPRTATILCLEDTHFGVLTKKNFN
jgi:CRP-like cAMP-binding protein